MGSGAVVRSTPRRDGPSLVQGQSPWPSFCGLPARRRRPYCFASRRGRVPVMSSRAARLPLKDPDLLRQANLIGGAWVQADDGRVLEVRNPANGELVGVVPAMGAAETRRAIEAAAGAQAAWRRLIAKERQKPLRKLFD